ncbi:hypothetical protein NLM27_43065 [Bradyrhizobium sp. CCGB12]|uniref:DUF6894 family protein n=1 Tax=Bradyrhizobium sp. CCGB12 TaxID=2949632 RepID=UPI0020B38942|nr:hypothetical protein [Bradyrhizobium sp. CCGB12]MCP3395479.1 hypothetical protein [Bradyrhizobium sp. CCGB12]
MAQYSFKVSNGDLSYEMQELPDDETAWREAVKTVKDIETNLHSSGGSWSLVVTREGDPLYRIDVRVQKFGG